MYTETLHNGYRLSFGIALGSKLANKQISIQKVITYLANPSFSRLPLVGTPLPKGATFALWVNRLVHVIFTREVS